MHRREYLVTAGALGLSAVTGCSGDGEDGADGEDTTTTTEETTTTTQETTTTEEQTTTEEETTEETTEETEPASFEVVETGHPDEVDVGESHRISVTVENTGGESGTFEELLEVSVEGDDQWENVGFITLEDIEPGETATWESNEVSFEQPGTIQFRLGNVEWSYSILITAPDPQSFAGTGEEVRRGVTIEGGLTVVEATHEGNSNFQVSLAGEGDFDDNFINVIGDFDGAQADLIEEGEYILDVNADGSWEVTIRQPRSGEGDSLPVSFSGNAPDVVGPVRFSGTGVATGSHSGDSNFQVQIYPMKGSFGELVFNEIGTFEGETTYSFDGIGWIDVNANGNWSLEFE